ncbi:MAG TPA: ATP-binding protein [Nocardioidaceae bacterium]|nr:ATP-binding protein [Nocardioidaceae bacterium]
MESTDRPVRVSSLDGRGFLGELPIDVPLLPGDFVLIEPPERERLLGQVLDRRLDGRSSSVSGALRAAVAPDETVGPISPRPFADATLGLPPPPVVNRFQRWAGADLRIGTTLSGHGVEAPALVRRKGFNRHTFVCGQSGSGKTYALGVLLEQLIAHTELPMIIVDPNADFVRLGHVRVGADPQQAQQLGSPDVRALRASPDGPPAIGEQLAVSFAQMRSAAKAAALRVDPIADRDEYNDLLHILDESAGQQEMAAFVEQLDNQGDEVARAVVKRVQNLGILNWDIWARGRTSLLDLAETHPRCLVLDVSGCHVPQERTVATLALLDHLWGRREERRPVLVVVDEAHNLCTPDPVDALQAAVTDRLVQIAAEGRKYGLWLMLSTQQPRKIHPNVLSQCDNLVLMRMNSTADLATLGDVFGAAPPQMLSTATAFRQGELLLTGGFVAAPMIARVAERLTEEGGSDVAVPLGPPPPE